MTSDKNILHGNVVNRAEARRADILAALDSLGAVGARAGVIGHLPTTGDLIDAMGLARDAGTYASVSRSLRRMHAAGLVRAWLAELHIQGRGYRWSR